MYFLLRWVCHLLLQGSGEGCWILGSLLLQLLVIGVIYNAKTTGRMHIGVYVSTALTSNAGTNVYTCAGKQCQSSYQEICQETGHGTIHPRMYVRTCARVCLTRCSRTNQSKVGAYVRTYVSGRLTEFMSECKTVHLPREMPVHTSNYVSDHTSFYFSRLCISAIRCIS